MTISRQARRLLLAAAATALIAACDRQTVYTHYEHPPTTGWDKNDTLNFRVSAIEQGGIYREEVRLRINTLYPFQGLCLIVEQQRLPMGITRSDTLNCSLIDSKGNMKGKGVTSFQYSFPLTDIELNPGDSLSIGIRHNMKREILPGITDIGVAVKLRP
ncbi:MAG: gliding motility lipoprotein GldH [Prevotella sp.]|nr:gliding motility lipoprotein GldH [Prevotella sp.]